MESPWTAAPGVQWEELDGEAVVVNPDRAKSWVLNSTATQLWKRLGAGKDPASIARELAKAGQDAQDLVAGIVGFAEELVAAGVLLPRVATVGSPASAGVRPGLQPAPRIKRVLPLEKGPKRPHPRMGTVDPNE